MELVTARPVPVSFDRAMTFGVASLAVALAALFRLERVSFAGAGFLNILIALGPLAVVAIYCRWAKLAQLENGCRLIGWALVLTALLPLPSYAAARLAFPLADARLLIADRIIGIDVGRFVAWTHAHSAADRAARFVYGLMQPLVFAAIVLPAIAGRRHAAERLLVSVLIAVGLGSLLFMLMPALGPWTAYGFTPYDNQANVSSELLMLRASSAAVIDPAQSGGLIAFPSFHVALSILAAIALAGFRWLRIPAALIACAIAVSTMAVGWHYAIDVLGGILVAYVANCGSIELVTTKLYKVKIPVPLPAPL